MESNLTTYQFEFTGLLTIEAPSIAVAIRLARDMRLVGGRVGYRTSSKECFAYSVTVQDERVRFEKSVFAVQRKGRE